MTIDDSAPNGSKQPNQWLSTQRLNLTILKTIKNKKATNAL